MPRQRIVRPTQVIEVPDVGADVTVERAGGNLFMVTPVSDNAKEWVEEHIQLEGWQWLGSAFSVDQHCIENLVQGMIGDGLEVA